MNNNQEPNYNCDGVDLNIYTFKRDEEIEYYADKLDFLREFHKDKYNLIITVIEMCSIINHDITNFKKENEKNILIRKISKMQNKKDLRVIKKIVDSFTILQNQ